MRLLQSFEEMEEPFEKSQIGSSAMPYKRNPMRCERISSLARYVIADSVNPAMTAGTQWFERTLDDSANKRISVAEAFLAVDSILNIYINVTSGLVVYENVIKRRVMEKLPFMATENIIMEGVKNGGDRQELHEEIRVMSMEAGKVVKEQGKDNDLLERVLKNEKFQKLGITEEKLKEILDLKKFVGRAPGQVKKFVSEEVRPAIDAVPNWDNLDAGELKV